jgi:hypothetical protein
MKDLTGEDVELFNKMEKVLVEDDPEKIDFVYGWSGVNYHLSHGTTLDTMDERAYTQLKEMNLVGKKYWIEPNYQEYVKYVKLSQLHEKNGEDLEIKHIKPGEIDITHLL